MFWRTKAGSTSVMLPGRATNTSGAGLAIAYNTSGLAAAYRREGSSSFTTINLASATAGTFTSSGLAVPSGGVTGAFELHPPNAAFATGAKWVEIQLSGATGMQDLAWFVALDAVDYQYTDTLLSSDLHSSGYYSATSTQYAFTASGVSNANVTAGGLKGRLFSIISGTGAGQDRVISGSSVSVGVMILTFETALEVTPDSTSVWVVRRSRLPVLDSSLRVKANVEQVNAQTASATASVDFDGLATIVTNVASILGKFTGITLLGNWLRALARKSTPDATALSEINSGGGDYSATTDALQAIKDAGVEVDEAAVASAVWAASTRTLTSTMRATVDSPFIATKDLPAIPLASGPSFQWTVVDSSGNAIDLSTKTVRFVVATVDESTDEFSKYDDVLSGAFQYQSSTAALVISGTSSNVVTVQVDSDDVTAIGSGEHRYWIWDVTTAGAERVLVKGKFPVEPAVRSA